MSLLFCIALIVLTYRLGVRNLRNRASVKSGALATQQHSKSGRPAEPVLEVLGSAVRASKQDVFNGWKTRIGGFRIHPSKR
jgi:hypothetical protein